MSHDDPVLELLQGLAPPAPPPELEGITLADAGSALRQRRTPDAWERAWASRPLRVAWMTALVALIAGHVLLSLRPDPVAVASGARAVGRDRLPAEIATMADLPRIVLSTAAFESGDGPVMAPAARPAGRTEEVHR